MLLPSSQRFSSPNPAKHHQHLRQSMSITRHGIESQTLNVVHMQLDLLSAVTGWLSLRVCNAWPICSHWNFSSMWRICGYSSSSHSSSGHLMPPWTWIIDYCHLWALRQSWLWSNCGLILKTVNYYRCPFYQTSPTLMRSSHGSLSSYWRGKSIIPRFGTAEWLAPPYPNWQTFHFGPRWRHRYESWPLGPLPCVYCELGSFIG